MRASPLRQFLFRLALLQGKTVRQLGNELDGHELSEWIAYDRYISPLPDPWLQTAWLCALMANVMGNGKRRYTPADFLPRVGQTLQTEAEMKARLDLFVGR